MKELIDLVERAPGPDRRIDGRIALVVDPDRFKELQLDADSDMAALASVFGVPRYTESIDAALLIVPANSDWSIEPDGCWVRWMGKKDVEEAQGVLCGRDRKATAIAICLAALRARACQQKAGTE